MSKTTISIVSLLVAAAIVGAYFFPRGNTIVQQITTGGTNAVGTTFNTAKFAGIASVPLTGTATTSSILNSDATDRYVTQVRLGCESVGTSVTAYTGSGLAALTLAIATSSTANPVKVANGTMVGLLTIATSSPVFTLASTTLQSNLGTSTPAMLWATGTYLSFGWNATNTAACTVGVDYITS